MNPLRLVFAVMRHQKVDQLTGKILDGLLDGLGPDI